MIDASAAESAFREVTADDEANRGLDDFLSFLFPSPRMILLSNADYLD